MRDSLSDAPNIFNSVIFEGIIYNALYDDLLTVPAYEDALFGFLTERYVDLFTDNMVIDEDGVIVEISDLLTEQFNWNFGNELHTAAELAAEQTVDMFVEFDIVDTDLHEELVYVLSNITDRCTLDPLDPFECNIDMTRKKVTINATNAGGRVPVHIPNFFMESSNENTIHFRPGSS